jgi:hypothetical protein
MKNQHAGKAKRMLDGVERGGAARVAGAGVGRRPRGRQEGRRLAQAAVEPPAAALGRRRPVAAKGGEGRARWLRVRAFEKDAKGETHKRVSVNLPLSLCARSTTSDRLCHHRWHDDATAGEKDCNIRLAAFRRARHRRGAGRGRRGRRDDQDLVE